MKLLRKLLFPIVPIYHGVTWLRNIGYDKGILKSKSYDFPVICVGNLSVGGTGKSPMIEYLIRLLKDEYKIATLSRGYKRSTQGFQIANDQSSALTIGDEPYQFFNKFKDIIVSVDANRQNGISKLRQLNSKPDVILLDDAFQHRKVEAGFNILLTKYNNLYVDDFALPTGDLREPKSGAKRADVIIVTKCPDNISEEEKTSIVRRLKPEANQTMFFSSISYSNKIFSKDTEKELEHLNHTEFTLITGIADASPLVNHLKKLSFNFEHLNFKDHHVFSDTELNALAEKSLIITTEKDFVRLKDALPSDKLFYLPIEANILDSKSFDAFIKNYVVTC